jgi:hypothetical protein
VCAACSGSVPAAAFVNYAAAVIRQYASAYPAEGEQPDEVVAFRAYPVADDLDAERITQEIRVWLLDGRHTRFLFEERRKYADVGAAGSSVEFVLSLLGSAAAQVALEQIVSFVRERLGGDSQDEWRRQPFRESSAEQLRDDALSTAERVLELSRGDLAVIDFDRGDHSITLKVESRSSGRRYRVTLEADESIRVRLLPSPRDT